MSDDSDLPRRLADAIATRTAISPDADDLPVERAYELQDELIGLLGKRPVAAKLGLTSVAKQQQMNVAEPAYGWLLEGSQVEVGTELPCGELIQPRCEPEIAFLVGRDLEGPDVSASEVLAATDAVMPAIDVLDSRYAGYSFTLPAVVADNISSARYALGRPTPVTGLDLRLLGCLLEVDGRLVATAAGAAVLDHPAAAVAWFVRSLAHRGRRLEAGTVVLSGALTAAVPVRPGSVVRVTVDRLGSVELRCGP
ncbi:fumarylacetoacetate hydrolase family protein [Phycicoccus sp.]|uniref:2-keto-4-pentenoate hydratase n=1 Tax=Phycicoccus sp. TaxID=1902410 RepID=UPI002BE9973D|nr:fumarylacetoacetate hydrolase family protein [Phycicoccus sp.]HMM95994.1 fumarylacetoacetate hydrolase family protein [Phycicoccus sp.]